MEIFVLQYRLKHSRVDTVTVHESLKSAQEWMQFIRKDKTTWVESGEASWKPEEPILKYPILRITRKLLQR